MLCSLGLVSACGGSGDNWDRVCSAIVTSVFDQCATQDDRDYAVSVLDLQDTSSEAALESECLAEAEGDSPSDAKTASFETAIYAAESCEGVRGIMDSYFDAHL